MLDPGFDTLEIVMALLDRVVQEAADEADVLDPEAVGRLDDLRAPCSPGRPSREARPDPSPRDAARRSYPDDSNRRRSSSLA
jgi:hypothetical protein